MPAPPVLDKPRAGRSARPSAGRTEPRPAYVTAEEYLRSEEDAEIKHEWIDGKVREMAGSTDRHGALAWRIGTRLDVAFEDEPFVGFSNDVKVRVPDGPYYYPDGSLTVAPGEFEPPVRPGGRPTVLLTPAVIVEILSDSTAHIDRGEKLDGYRTIPSLRDYLLFRQDRAEVEHHFRAGGGWDDATYRGRDAAFALTAGGTPLNLGGIYSILDRLPA